jgi:hypothetical protein
LFESCSSLVRVLFGRASSLFLKNRPFAERNPNQSKISLEQSLFFSAKNKQPCVLFYKKLGRLM